MAEVFALYEPFFLFDQFPSLFFHCARNSVQFSLMAEYFIGCLQLESLVFFKLSYNRHFGNDLWLRLRFGGAHPEVLDFKSYLVVDKQAAAKVRAAGRE